VLFRSRSCSPARMAAFMSSWIRSLSVMAQGSAWRPHPVARDALHVTLDGCRLLAFSFLGGLLVEFAAPELREDAGLLAGTLEAPQGGIEIFVFADTNARHRNLNSNQISSPGAPAKGRDSKGV